jgi:hypothetical protein
MSAGGSWTALLVSFAVNAGILYFLGSRLERLARGERL